MRSRISERDRQIRLGSPDIERAAEDLFEAESKRRQIGLLSRRHPGMGLADAYRIQDRLVERIENSGKRRIGWKIGLTSKAMQRALNIEIPDSGVLFDSMLFENGARIPRGRFIEPRVEVEIAFVFGRGVAGAGVDRDQVLDATSSVAPALEILDTRIVRQDPESGKKRLVVDTVADNAANAGLVLGDARVAPGAVDLRWMGAILERNGVVEETGLGAGVLNDPAESVAWLARRLAEFGGEIGPGDIVLSGSFTRPLEAMPGSRIRADFGKFGSVSCSFE
ncbi:MAG: 2-oxo-hepta-3-ene-1,7-dioic acid hydratase [Albidovulum sp.]|nr:2-oxo-hepta-3-ene-1,7-dioic acid hydratase [Albidovulum sp.]